MKIHHALVFAVVLISGHVHAEPMNACIKPPPTPKGHLLAKVTSASAYGVSETLLKLDKGGTSVKPENDVHLLSCEGRAIEHDASDVYEVGDVWSTAKLKLPMGMTSKSVVGMYVAIDSGADSAAPTPANIAAAIPKGWRAGSITGQVNTEVRFNLGARDGVLPGDKGIYLTSYGSKIADFRIITVGERYSLAVGPRSPVKEKNVAIDPSSKDCTPSSSTFISAHVSQDVKDDDSAPTTSFYEVTVHKGSQDRIYPKAKIKSIEFATLPSTTIGVPTELEVKAVRESSAITFFRGPKGLKLKSAQVAVGSCK